MEKEDKVSHHGAGHACLNLYLSCGVCDIAAFSEDHMNDPLELDGLGGFVINIVTVREIN